MKCGWVIAALLGGGAFFGVSVAQQTQYPTLPALLGNEYLALAYVAPPASLPVFTTPPQIGAYLTKSSGVLPTNWVQQYHQNGGGTCYGHVLCWGDQNYDIQADHFGVQSQDASVSTTATLGGSNTVGDQIGWQIGASHSYMTVVTGDTSTTIINKLASLLNGGAQTATVAAAGSGYTNGDVVTLPSSSVPTCPHEPKFTLTVGGGIVTAAAIAGSGGSAIMGGYCQSTPAGTTFATTGGTGSGITRTL
jgi:hypothetical protein